MEAAAAAEDEARISTGTEKLQREVSGAKSWLGKALGSSNQRSLSGSLIPGVRREAGLHSFTWKKWPTPPPAPIPGRHSSSHQPNRERKEWGEKTRSAKPRILASCFSQKKFESLSGYSKNHCWNHGQVQTREGFARPVLRGFGVVQFTHLRDQCLGRSWANFSQAGWYGDIQGILCGAALLS